MDLRDRQAKGYIEEAELTLTSAEVILKEAKETGKNLWAQVVKNAYDSMEQALSAALAKKDLVIPRDHPAKVISFINTYNLRNTRIEALLSKWVGRRGRTHYVDIHRDKLFIPHEIFDEHDAEDVVKDASFVIEYVKKLVGIK